MPIAVPTMGAGWVFVLWIDGSLAGSMSAQVDNDLCVHFETRTILIPANRLAAATASQDTGTRQSLAVSSYMIVRSAKLLPIVGS